MKLVHLRWSWILVLCALSARASSSCESGSDLLFAQPVVSQSSIDDLLVSPRAGNVSKPPPLDRFSLIFWQRNPRTADGRLVPKRDSSAALTGIDVGENQRESMQRGEASEGKGVSVQAVGDAVGAFLTSEGFPTPKQGIGKLMITPQYKWSNQRAVKPFANGDKITVDFQLQVPIASAKRVPGSGAYVTSGLLFVDPGKGTRLSLGAGAFSAGKQNWSGGIAIDPATHGIMVNSPISPTAEFIYVPPESADYTAETWRGWKEFRYEIDAIRFKKALESAASRYPELRISTDPADYILQNFHLNAEIRYDKGDAMLGWSMRNARICMRERHN